MYARTRSVCGWCHPPKISAATQHGFIEEDDELEELDLDELDEELDELDRDELLDEDEDDELLREELDEDE